MPKYCAVLLFSLKTGNSNSQGFLITKFRFFIGIGTKSVLKLKNQKSLTKTSRGLIWIIWVPRALEFAFYFPSDCQDFWLS